MNTMMPFLVSATVSLLLLSPAARAADWVSLFDGKSLEGWIQKNGTATYRVENGAIVGRTAEGSPNSFLCTVKEYADFELEFEVRVDDALNSGVQVRSQTRGGTPDGRVNGPQIEIEASPGESGYVYGEGTDRGWLTPESRLKTHSHFKNGEWNKYRIVAQGARIQTWINSEMIEDLTDEPIFKTHPKGFIGLQVHSIGKGQGPFEVAWRNIRVKETR